MNIKLDLSTTSSQTRRFPLAEVSSATARAAASRACAIPGFIFVAGWLSEAERAHMLDARSALSSTPEGAGGPLGVEGGRDSEKSEAAHPLVRAKAAMLKLSPVLFSTTEYPSEEMSSA